MRRMPESITVRLVTRFTVVAASTFLLFSIALLLFLRAQLQRQLEDALRVRIDVASLMISHVESASAWERIRVKLHNMQSPEGNIALLVQTPDPSFSYPWINGVSLPTRFDGYQKVDAAGRSMLAVKHLIPAARERPPLVLAVFIDRTSMNQTLYHFALALLVTSSFGIILIYAIGSTIARHGLLPLKRFSRQAAELEPNVRGQRLSSEGLPNELLPLHASLNDALARIDSGQMRLDAFNADVAHELRTPISNIRGQLHVALTKERSHATLIEVIQSVAEETERMRVIINDMLFLSRADQGEIATERESISLAQEVRHTLAFMEAAFEDAELTSSVSGDGVMMANKSLLRRALFNLLLNASQHAGAGTQVRISIVVAEATLEVHVANVGPPILESVRCKLFDRFYRSDASRSTIAGNNGLGLAIVKAIADMHRGSTFVLSQDGWNVFGFALPISGS